MRARATHWPSPDWSNAVNEVAPVAEVVPEKSDREILLELVAVVKGISTNVDTLVRDKRASNLRLSAVEGRLDAVEAEIADIREAAVRV